MAEMEYSVSSEFIKEYEGKPIRAYLFNGASVAGTITFKKGWVNIENVNKNQSVLCNLDYVVSIARNY